MSLDAMDWVWTHSQSKGTARLVLLAIADRAYGTGCTAYAGTTMLMTRTNAARSSVIAAVDKLIALGELAVVDGQTGPRGETVYTLPKARRHRRSTPEGGPDFGPVRNLYRSEIRTGTDSGPGGSENRTGRGPKSGPLNTRNTNTNPPTPHAPTTQPTANAEDEGRIPRAFDYIQPLISAMTQAGISVSWQMPADDIQAIAVIQRRAGVTAMVDFARKVKVKHRSPNPITHATYFLRAGWGGLPPAAAPAPTAPPLPPHCGHPDCDPDTRRRETEDDKGLRSLIPCPDCHPTTQKGHAA